MERLFERVEEASKVMAEYNKRLEEELKERQEIQELLDVFIWQQKGLLREAKKKLKVKYSLVTYSIPVCNIMTKVTQNVLSSPKCSLGDGGHLYYGSGLYHLPASGPSGQVRASNCGERGAQVPPCKPP